MRAPTRTVASVSVPRADGVAKVTGAARYAIDLTVPGMAHAVAVRSTRAHARIAGIKHAAAAASPGVLRVITATPERVWRLINKRTG